MTRSDQVRVEVEDKVNDELATVTRLGSVPLISLTFSPPPPELAHLVMVPVTPNERIPHHNHISLSSSPKLSLTLLSNY
jgi:hypothetical protein